VYTQRELVPFSQMGRTARPSPRRRSAPCHSAIRSLSRNNAWWRSNRSPHKSRPPAMPMQVRPSARKVRWLRRIAPATLLFGFCVTPWNQCVPSRAVSQPSFALTSVLKPREVERWSLPCSCTTALRPARQTLFRTRQTGEFSMGRGIDENPEMDTDLNVIKRWLASPSPSSMR
jgi:hypothetical protein